MFFVGSLLATILRLLGLLHGLHGVTLAFHVALQGTSDLLDELHGELHVDLLLEHFLVALVLLITRLREAFLGELVAARTHVATHKHTSQSVGRLDGMWVA